MKISLQRIRIEEVNFGERHRKDYGDLKGLAASIKTLGLLHPITVTKINGGYKLLAGGRRLKAMRDVLGESMIEANVVKHDKPLEHVLIEKHENADCLPFSKSEMVAIGASIEALLEERRGRPEKGGPRSTFLDEEKQGKTRDLVAEDVGFESGKQYERAKKVVDNGTPELVEAMDKGDVSVTAAAKIADAPKREQRAAVKAARQPKAPKKSGKVVFDDRKVQQAVGTLIRLIDDRGNKIGKTAEYRECVDAMEKVSTAWKRWQKAST